jgi:mono/diheme cytochrome c family protein
MGALVGGSLAVWPVVTAGRQAAYSGSDDYRIYCRSCHGASGKGDGAIGKTLKKPPADLTQLTKLNNGTFPEERIFKTIEGHAPDSEHARTDMPAWGEVFAKSSGSAGAENAAARIRALVAYVRTLQEK